MSNILEREITVPSILKFTFPSIVMMVMMSLYTVVDGTFVSRLVGTDAFSSVNIVYPLMSITIGLGTMFGTGMTALVSRKLGEGKREEANQIFTFITVCTVVLGLAVSVVCLVFLEPIIYVMGANEELYGYCYDYAMPLVFFFVPNMLQLMFQSLYVADGKPQIGLIVTVIGGLTNVVLDYVFIADFHMGITGAAVATGIGYSIPTLYGIWYFARNRRGNFCFVRPKTNYRALFQAASNGASEMVNFLSTSITTFLFNIIMIRLAGKDGVAAISILLYLDFVLIAISLGYSMGVAPLISYNYGRGNGEKLKRLYKVSIGFCMAVSITMTAGTILFADPLSAIFTKRGTAVYDMAVVGLRIYAISYLFKGYNIYASAMFTAYGDGKTSAILSFMRTLVFLVVTLIGLAALFGITGVWYATPIAEMLALTMSIYFTFKYRKRLKLR